MKNRGIWYGLAAYFIWGLFPAYWKLLKSVPALQIIGHRMAWSFIFLMGFVLLSGQWSGLRRAAFKPRVLAIYLLAALLVSVNWLVYVWSVNAGFIVETSLGYFINPLISVLMGVIFLRERLCPWQWVPVGLATAGVLYLTVTYGTLPWIALALAFSFGLYGLVKKLAPLNSLHGLTLETGLMFLLAVGYLLFAELRGEGAFGHGGWTISLLLAGAGIVTTVPLLLFAAAARRTPLSVMGVLQYIAPTLQFLMGVLIYQEPFTHIQLIGFGFVWLALILFWAEGIYVRRTRQALAAAG